MKSVLLLLKVLVWISLVQSDGDASILAGNNYKSYRTGSSKYPFYKGLNHFYKKGKERYYKYPTYYRYRQAKPARTVVSPVSSSTVRYEALDHKRRLRELLVPLPRHIAGPVPTF